MKDLNLSAHTRKIALDTLKMPDAMVGVMGGMTKAEAYAVLGVKPPPWVTCQNTEPWKACQHPTDYRHWYIFNIWTGKYVKIGEVKSSGVNYLDRAVDEAERRNRKLRGKE